jgi:hypothetical protein
LASATIDESFRRQARICRAMGSPMYGALLERAAENHASGGPVAALSAHFDGHPVLDNLPLRILGAVHRLVLAGRVPRLAAFYPSLGGHFESAAAWPEFERTLGDHLDELAPLVQETIQTNEVLRCCALLGGFLASGRAFGLPLRLLEIGASAGLNQLFDRYAYLLGPHRFGPERAPLTLRTDWRGPAPDLAAPLRVTERSGCDLDPVDVRDPSARLRLLSYFWPDQHERLERVRTALEVAQRNPAPLSRERAGDWLEPVLADPAVGVTTVLFHSVMWWYVPETERRRIAQLVAAAGSRASEKAPLAWLRLEGVDTEQCELRLQTWPDGTDRLLARAHYHGVWVEWLEG